MENIFKKAYVIAYFDSVGGVDFFHGFNIDGVPMWGCFAEALRVSPVTAWSYLRCLGSHSGFIQVVSFKEAQDAIFNQYWHTDFCDFVEACSDDIN